MRPAHRILPPRRLAPLHHRSLHRLGIHLYQHLARLSAAAHRCCRRQCKREDSRLFKKGYVEKTHAFFDRYGGRAIILARFVPIVRTFITAIAGVARMDFRRFMIFSAIGGIIWAVGVTLAGYFLGTIPIVKDNVETVLLLVVLLSVIPIVWAVIKHRRQRGAADASPRPRSASEYAAR